MTSRLDRWWEIAWMELLHQAAWYLTCIQLCLETPISALSWIEPPDGRQHLLRNGSFTDRILNSTWMMWEKNRFPINWLSRREKVSLQVVTELDIKGTKWKGESNYSEKRGNIVEPTLQLTQEKKQKPARVSTIILINCWNYFLFAWFLRINQLDIRYFFTETISRWTLTGSFI